MILHFFIVRNSLSKALQPGWSMKNLVQKSKGERPTLMIGKEILVIMKVLTCTAQLPSEGVENVNVRSST